MELYAWFFVTAVVSTLLGMFFAHDGVQRKHKKIVEETIDVLMKSGYLRYQRNDDGEIEILKL